MDHGVFSNCNYGDYSHSLSCGEGVSRDTGYRILEWANRLQKVLDDASYPNIDIEELKKIVDEMYSEV